MSEQLSTAPQAEDDSSPRHKHLRKLAEEAEALKKQKENQKHLVKTEIEIVHDTRGRPKYRKVFRMPNGTKHTTYINPKSPEVEKFKAQKKR